MSLLSIGLAIAIIACIVISVQSARVYYSSNLNPALFFALAVGAITMSLGAVLIAQIDSQLSVVALFYNVGLHLSVLGLCVMSVYAVAKNRVQFVLGVLASLVIVGLHGLLFNRFMPSSFLTEGGAVEAGALLPAIGGVTVVLLVPLFFSITRQFADAIARPLVAVRLLLMLLFALSITYVYVADSYKELASFSTLAIVYAFSFIVVILALTSLLTPIRHRSDVRRPIY